MSTPRVPALRRAVDDVLGLGRGFTPSVKDLPELVGLLASDDEDKADAAARAIAQLADKATPLVLGAIPPSVRPARARLVKLLGRLAAAVPTAEAQTALARLTRDADLKARLNAITALGSLQNEEAEAILLEVLRTAERQEVEKAALKALGTAGGEKAFAALTQRKRAALPAVAEAQEQALRYLKRTITRDEPGCVNGQATLSGFLIHLFCRRGLERLLIEEARVLGPARIERPGLVVLSTKGGLESIYSLRLLSHAAFRLPSRSKEPATATRDAWQSETAREILGRLQSGPVRYRLDWSAAADAAKKALAAELDGLVSGRLNDPRQSPWQLSVDDVAGLPEIWLVPRGVADDRFAYRKTYVYASSHPTIAAALARVAGARDQDVVWDPFAGSATELIERAKLGRAKRLFGTDVDGNAVTLARLNLEAAHVTAELTVADALTWQPPVAPTLILTNPPLGLRVHRGKAEALLVAFAGRAAELLAPGGRLVWISSFPKQTAAALEAKGLKEGFRQAIDMGGFDAELQAFTKPG